MKQLTGTDTMFLHLENPRASSGFTIVLVYDQSKRPGGQPIRFKEILGFLNTRLDAMPVLRHKIKRVLWDLDRPYWVKDPDFNLEHHVSHVRLPEPADWRQFCILAARHATPVFDMNRPLWHMMVVEGLDNVEGLAPGSFAILLRMHHVLVDGAAAIRLMSVLHDPSPDSQKLSPADYVYDPTPYQPPGFVEQVARAGMNNVTGLVKMAKPLLGLLTKIPGVVGQLKSEGGGSYRAPQTRFNNRVSPYRVFFLERFELADFKEFKALVPEATVNDAVLAVIGGALRRYLDAKDELPQRSLRTLMPVNTRSDAAGSVGNNITFTAATLGTEVRDILGRLQRVRESTSKSKEIMNAVGAKEMTNLTHFAPESALAFAGRLVSVIRMDAGGIGQPLFNTICTNVPGPQKPLYLLGAELKHFAGIGPVTDGLGLMFIIASYNGSLSIFPTACRSIVPDPEFLAECLRDSVSEMQKAIATARSRTTRRKATAPAVRKKARKKKARPKRTAREA